MKSYEGVHFFLALFGVSALMGAGFTLGCMAVCKVFRWAPVNTTVDVHIDDKPPVSL